jgi:hypothetical protein
MPYNIFRSAHVTPHLVRVDEAAELTGLSASLLRKTFMREEKRPKNIPSPPPHKRIGRAVYIVAEELPAWVGGLGKQPEDLDQAPKVRRGRPTVSERIAKRQGKAE